ncbi:RAB6-interacting golgin-like [Clavelina lepadiformis]|uniref:RAB6-interacting golgin n=1 Tax=Clavelina lepadiformis TaxID=159417 RepID=A0ABP0F563_CLALP
MIMSDWEGFTEADLRRLQKGENQYNAGRGARIAKHIATRKNQAPKKAMVQNKHPPAKKGSGLNDIPADAMLSQPPKPTISKSLIEEKKEVKETPQTSTSESSDPAPKMQIIDNEEAIKKREKLKLEDVHLRQKQMEEKNRRKKAMLTKEIAQRKKKALAESSKLVKIQAELTKLDKLLNCDVGMLRDKIDEACMEFSVAQKRFEKAEAEYIVAKVELHNKTVVKEDLTEHLFNLIQANEERKAKKLEELMHKLDVEEEELETKEIKEKEIKPDNEGDDPSKPENPPSNERSESEATKPDVNDTSKGSDDKNTVTSTKETETKDPKPTKTASTDASDSLHGAPSDKVMTAA